MTGTDTLKCIQPILLGANARSKNRLFFASMGLDLCDLDGLPTRAFFEFYQSLIGGGFGFGYLCNASVTALSRFNSRGLKLVSERHAQALSPLFDFAKSNDVVLGVQLQHYGAQGKGPALTPSGIPLAANTSAIEMTEKQIYDCIDQFVEAARLAKQAGAQAIQLQAANGYLLSSFLSPRTNRRADDWGGSEVKRTKLVTTIIERIVDVTNHEIPVSVRLGIDDGFEGVGQKPERLQHAIRELEKAGASAIECSIGVSETFRLFFKNTEETLTKLRQGTKLLKSHVDIPVGFSGSVFSVATAEEIVSSGDADFIGFARAALADNQLIHKELAGHTNDVHRCLGDAFCFRDKKEPMAERVYCCVNPQYQRPAHLQKMYEEGVK